jgi:hypothetical protein
VFDAGKFMRHGRLNIAQLALLVCLSLMLEANAAETANQGAVPGGRAASNMLRLIPTTKY